MPPVSSNRTNLHVCSNCKNPAPPDHLVLWLKNMLVLIPRQWRLLGPLKCRSGEEGWILVASTPKKKRSSCDPAKGTTIQHPAGSSAGGEVGVLHHPLGLVSAHRFVTNVLGLVRSRCWPCVQSYMKPSSGIIPLGSGRGLRPVRLCRNANRRPF